MVIAAIVYLVIGLFWAVKCAMGRGWEQYPKHARYVWPLIMVPGWGVYLVIHGVYALDDITWDN